MEAETLAHVYKNLWMVEDLFRTAKSILETRPLYHKCDETIRGHIFSSFLALVLKCEVESRLRQSGLAWEWAEVIRGLDSLQQVKAILQGGASCCAAIFRGRLANLACGRGGRSADLTRAFLSELGGRKRSAKAFCLYVSP
jgi:hypothetical protein